MCVHSLIEKEAILNEVRQREISYDFLYMRNLEKKWYRQTHLQNRNRLTNLENKFMVARGKWWGEGTVRESGVDMYTLLYLKWINTKVILCNTGNSAQRYVTA